MAIDLKNFVDININYSLSSISSTTRDTAILYVNKTEDQADKYYDVVFESLQAVTRYFTGETATVLDNRYAIKGELYYYVYCFFNNGGKKLRIVGITKPVNKVYEQASLEDTFTGKTYYLNNSSLYTNPVTATPLNANDNAQPLFVESSGEFVPSQVDHFESNVTYYKDVEGTVEASPSNCNLVYDTGTTRLATLEYEDLVPRIQELDYSTVVICSNASYIVMDQVAKTINQDDFNIYTKSIITGIDASTISNIDSISFEASKGLYVKYGVLGVEMSIAAYLTQININKTNSVNDYNFTLENVQYKVKKEGTEDQYDTIGYVCNNNALAEKLMKKEINFNSSLVNSIRNIGGNDVKGYDLVNQYVLILLHQTLTERLVNLLTQKIKYNQTGLSLIGATLADELQKYVDNGYLSTDKSWTDSDLIYEGVVVIAQNTPLQIGYKYVILPFSVLTAEEKKEHKLPPIYILIADSYGIRKIEINGEVF